MPSLATPGANAILDGTAIGATLYAQLHTGDPGTNGTANIATETARKSFTRAAASGGATANAGIIEWLNYPANETITHVTVWSASSGGTCWLIVDNANTAVLIGETVQILAGDLDLVAPVWP